MSHQSLSDIRWDARLTDRNLRKGALARAEHAAQLEKLPDVAGKSVELDEQRLLREAQEAGERMRERLKTQPFERRRTLPVPTTSFEDEEYGSITPEDEVEEDEDE